MCMQHLVMKLSEKLDDVDRDGRKDVFFSWRTVHTHAPRRKSKLIGISKKWSDAIIAKYIRIALKCAMLGIFQVQME